MFSIARQAGQRAVKQRLLDDIGISTVVFYAVGSAFGLDIPESVLIAGTGLILYKTVAANGSNGNGDKDGSP